MSIISIGKRIRKERLRRGWTQGELAWRAEISTAALSAYERGARAISIGAAARVAKALGISVKSLITGKPQDAPEPSTAALSDVDVDVLYVLHRKIMFFAVLWARDRGDSKLFRGAVTGAIHSWRDVAKVLGVPSKLIEEGFLEYVALVDGGAGC